MTDDNQPSQSSLSAKLQLTQLTESYRFDQELADLLTAFTYQDDGIALTAHSDHQLPTAAIDPPTAGIDAAFSPAASLVFVCYDDRGHQMVNPVEATLTDAITQTVATTPTSMPADIDPPVGLAEDHHVTSADCTSQTAALGDAAGPSLSLGVVTPHNAQRGLCTDRLPSSITANTVEKFQGGERDIIAVSATVADPEFARAEEQFILNPRRLLVAISRSRFLTIVICSTALFEVAPKNSEHLAYGPVWGRLFTEAVGRDPDPAWTGPLAEFVGDDDIAHDTVPVRVYPSSINDSGGERQ